MTREQSRASSRGAPRSCGCRTCFLGVARQARRSSPRILARDRPRRSTSSPTSATTSTTSAIIEPRSRATASPARPPTRMPDGRCARVHYRCRAPGGHGAFRDFAEWILALARTTPKEGSHERHAASASATSCVGDGEPVFVIAEIGINHNGSLELAKQLIDGAVLAGCRRGEVPEAHARAVRAARPVGHRARHALGPHDLHRLPPPDRVRRRASTPRSTATAASAASSGSPRAGTRRRSTSWSSSTRPATRSPRRRSPTTTLLAQMQRDRPAAHPLDRHVDDGGDRRRRSTAVGQRRPADRALDVDATPARSSDLNLRMIDTLKRAVPRRARSATRATRSGLAPTWAAVALGATFVERHITLDRAMWGSDQAASVEIGGLHAPGRATSATSSARWATASSASTRASCRRAQKLRRVQPPRRVERRCDAHAAPGESSRRSSSSARRWSSSLLERRCPYDRGQRFLRDGLLDRSRRLRARPELRARRSSSPRSSRWLDGATGAVAPRTCVAGWPLAAQVAFFVVTHDLYIYWFHRWQHRVAAALADPRGAPLDAPTSTGSSGARSHALEILINQTIEFAPIVLLGAAPEVALIKGVDRRGLGHVHPLQHRRAQRAGCSGSSTARRCTAGTTRVDDRRRGTNFATKLAVWDWLFGTAHRPTRKPRATGSRTWISRRGTLRSRARRSGGRSDDSGPYFRVTFARSK